MAHVSEHRIQLYLLGCLADGDADRVGLHLGECRACCTRLLEALASSCQPGAISASLRGCLKERRKEARVRADEPATLLQLHPLILERRSVQILDVSRGGLTVSSEEPMDVGTIVQIRTHTTFILGEVRYCLRNDGRFHSGLQMHGSVMNPACSGPRRIASVVPAAAYGT
jgi:hypothetical protein